MGKELGSGVGQLQGKQAQTFIPTFRQPQAKLANLPLSFNLANGALFMTARENLSFNSLW